MTAVRMWARAELRARWKAWALLGLLAGATFGLSAAAVVGARQTQDAVPKFVAAAHIPSAAILANDPNFDESQRAAVGALPEVTHSYPFLVAFVTDGRAAAGPRAADPADHATRTTRLLRRAARRRSRRPAGRRGRRQRSRARQVPPRHRVDDGRRPDRREPGDDPARAGGRGRGARVHAAHARGRDLEGELERPGLDAVGRVLRRSTRQQLLGFVNMFVDLRHGDADLARSAPTSSASSGTR